MKNACSLCASPLPGAPAEVLLLKALTVIQPWATFIALGLKTRETRSWDTQYRGPLLIHAARQVTKEGFTVYERIRSVLGPGPELPEFKALPRGVILCQVNLDSTCTTEEALRSGEITFLERTLGDYSPGRFVWSLTRTKVFEPALPAKGRLGLWDYSLGKK